jgi:hypothetical protein
MTIEPSPTQRDKNMPTLVMLKPSSHSQSIIAHYYNKNLLAAYTSKAACRPVKLHHCSFIWTIVPSIDLVIVIAF